MGTIEDIRRIAEIEFADIVKSIIVMDYKTRIILSYLYIDKSVSRGFGTIKRVGELRS